MLRMTQDQMIQAVEFMADQLARLEILKTGSVYMVSDDAQQPTPPPIRIRPMTTFDQLRDQFDQAFKTMPTGVVFEMLAQACQNMIDTGPSLMPADTAWARMSHELDKLAALPDPRGEDRPPL